MPSADKTFRDLELLNVKIDTWIDDEEYEQIYKRIEFEKSFDEQIKGIFQNDSEGNDYEGGKKRNLDELFRNLFSGEPEKTILIYNGQNGQKIPIVARDNWRPLFLAKYLRTKIQENGTDDYTKHLDDLVIYLQRKLPYQFPQEDQDEELILQHLYFQELSACGKPGLESLGFAVRAYELVKGKKMPLISTLICISSGLDITKASGICIQVKRWRQPMLLMK